MKINFFLKDLLKDKTSIDAIIRFKGNRYKLSTGISVEVKYWDKSKHRAKQIREYADHATINIKLEKFEIAAKEEFNIADIAGTIPTLLQLKNAMEKRLHPTATTAEDKNLFLPYFINHYETANIKSGTQSNYIITANFIRKYETYTRQKLTFNDITVNFYTHFKKWFYSIDIYVKADSPGRKYSKNYFSLVIRCIKTVMNEAGPENDNIHNNTEYKSKRFAKETEDSDTVYLSIDELNRIKLLEITPETAATLESQKNNLNNSYLAIRINQLHYVRNLFLIGCFTALRISDYSRIDMNNITDRYIRIKPKKGIAKNEDVVIPIHPVIRDILAAGFKFGKRLAADLINDLIKEICQLAAINEPITTVRTEGGRQVTRTTEKWKLVSSHTARRSGATNMFIAGVPSISIMKITGHKTERSFMKYIRISQEENARLLADHPFFKA